MSTSEMGAIPRLTTEELLHRLSDVAVVDVHGPSYFALGHILGAVNIPPHEVARLAPSRLSSTDVPVVVYGAAGSSNAVIVADQLRALGYREVSLYEEGLEAWIAAALPTGVIEEID